MRIRLFLIFIVCVMSASAQEEKAPGHWEDRGFVQTSDAAAAVFRITLECSHLTKPVLKQTLFFKRDWEFVQPVKNGGTRWFGRGLGTSIRACGFETWKSIRLGGTASDQGMNIDFHVRAGKMGSKVADVETGRGFEIPWTGFPHAEQDGDFAYKITFDWNTPK